MRKLVRRRKLVKIGVFFLHLVFIVAFCTSIVYAQEEVIPVYGQLHKPKSQTSEEEESADSSPLLEKKTLVKSDQLRLPSTGENKSAQYIVVGIVMLSLTCYTSFKVHFKE